MLATYQKLLISNRGEIACRVIRTAKRMGIPTVAVYSDADRDALHTKLADEAYYLGSSPSRDSYLCGDKIIAIAKQAGANAIHPGYGFLSENAEFALACEQADIIFVGPPAKAITAMGSKSAAKTQLEPLKVSLIPGYHGQAQDEKTLHKAAVSIGFPVLLKAASGGGGRGMRLVQQESELTEAIISAKREALSAFNDDTLLIEKYVVEPRHIEIQLFIDKQGQGIYLFERDCSIQRRHQKIIEEAPAFGLPRELIAQMGEAALTIAKAIGYVGAGTIEFLVDKNQQFYFMEMNTRLQVEHPITEMITGLDLVEWQLRIARGEPLPCQQADLTYHGHAIEVRICAENPYEGFVPASGLLNTLNLPPKQDWLRIDTGFTAGDTISRYYDSMIAKLVVWGENREQAVNRLKEALSAYQLTGVASNRDLLLAITQTPAYCEADIDTDFIAKHPQLLEKPTISDNILAFAASYFLVAPQGTKAHDPSSPWFDRSNWQANLPATQVIHLQSAKAVYDITLCREDMHYQVNINQATRLFIKLKQLKQTRFKNSILSSWEVEINGLSMTYQCVQTDTQIAIFTGAAHADLSLRTINTASEQQGQEQQLHAPMPAAVIAIPVQLKQQVKQGETLMVLEAMKMEHAIQAPFAGTVSAIYFNIGQVVQEGSKLVDIEPMVTASKT